MSKRVPRTKTGPSKTPKKPTPPRARPIVWTADLTHEDIVRLAVQSRAQQKARRSQQDRGRD
jgi:hypothetical protein